MKTEIFQATDLQRLEIREKIKKRIICDELVVFPTETVYGIGANALSETAVKKIFEVKGRPSDNPLIVHLSDKNDVYKYVKNISPYASTLMDAFWPGPLTLVFESNGFFPSIVTGGLKTVAIRVPSHNIAREIISLAGVPICAPSANISGKPSSTLFSHVKDDFDGLVSTIIDGGSTEIGLESTVLDLTVEIPSILRPGKITKNMIEEVLKIKIENHSEKLLEDAPKSPGMKYKHYAPKGVVTLVDGESENIIAYINRQASLHKNKKVACLCPDEFENGLNLETIIKLGSINKLETIGENLFKSLRMMDELNIDYIYIPVVSYEGLGEAIMNRLLKASNHNLVKV
jgi:L-threonylcarbamoyladenylate synthase